MAGASAQLQSGFWVGIGFTLAVLVWGILQMLFHRMEGR